MTQQANPQDRWRNMSPADRQRALQNEKRLQSMSPAQQQVLAAWVEPTGSEPFSHRFVLPT